VKGKRRGAGIRQERPVLRLAPRAPSTPSGNLEREVNVIVRTRVEEGCERAWTEIAYAFGLRELFPKKDPASVTARLAIRAATTELTGALARIAIGALLLPSEIRRSRDALFR
jgi:hypothetical protein